MKNKDHDTRRRDSEGRLLRKDGNVDHRCPPREYRFKPGQCGNKNRRPKEKKDYIEDQLFQALNERITVTENGKRKRLTKLEAAFKQLSNRAASGEVRAIKLLVQLSTQFANPTVLRPVTIMFEAGDEKF